MTNQQVFESLGRLRSDYDEYPLPSAVMVEVKKLMDSSANLSLEQAFVVWCMKGANRFGILPRDAYDAILRDVREWIDAKFNPKTIDLISHFKNTY